MTYPSVIALCILAIGLVSSRPILFYSFFAAGAFGSLSVLPTESIGGLTLLPQPLFALALLLRTLMQPGAINQAFRLVDDLGKLGLLFAFLGVALFTTIVAPRLFADSIVIVPMRFSGLSDLERGILSPTMANVTQIAYLTLSVFTALVFAILAQTPQFLQRLPVALLIGGIVLIATGIADMVAGDSGLLEPFRNASYALLVDNEILETKRVVGLMPEASAYGPPCVTMAAFLLFLRPAAPRSRTRFLMTVTALGLLGMAVLSTSSTAYVSIAFLAAVYGISFLARGVTPAAAPAAAATVKADLLILGLLLVSVLGVVLFSQDLVERAMAMVNSQLFEKSETTSYFGRKAWTDVSLEAFFSSYGLGVGVGSTRTSSWFVAVLSNTGIIGTALLAAFIMRLFMTRPNETDTTAAGYVSGLKLVLLCSLVPTAIAGTLVDFGALNGAIFGIIVGLASRDEAEQLERHALPAAAPMRASNRLGPQPGP
jgi:hypothetical protein